MLRICLLKKEICSVSVLHFKLDERKQQAKDYIAELMQLTEREQEYMNRFIAKEYVPELLFDDKEIVERIEEHPMAIWKCQQ